MKHIIFAILFLVASVGMSAVPHEAMAKRHRIVRHVRARRVVYRRRTVYVGSRSHGVNTNANVGVGVGPIHVGVGAGGGIQLHEALPPQHVIPDDPPSDPPTSMIPVPITRPEISSTGAVVAHHSDCDLECYNTNNTNTTTAAPTAAAAFIDTASVVTVTPGAVIAGNAITEPKNENERLMSGNSESFTEPYTPTDVGYVQQQFALSQDQSGDDYANYPPPRIVNIGGFNVPVNSNSAYYNPFKRGRSGLWYVHNRKGVDVAADYGVSPRAGAIPATIGGTGYTIITVER